VLPLTVLSTLVNRRLGVNRGDEPISALRYRLNYAWSFREIAQGSPQQRHGIGNDLFTHMHAAPNGFEKLLFPNDLSRMLRQLQEDLHGLGFEVNTDITPGDQVQFGKTTRS
jgi:hypothetical protein